VIDRDAGVEHPIENLGGRKIAVRDFS
jgi:hypothetical protein